MTRSLLFSQRRPSCRRWLRGGLMLCAIRLSVIWGLFILDRTLHPGLGFFYYLPLILFTFVPEGLLLERWTTTPIGLSGVVVFTSLVLVSLWVLFTPDARAEATGSTNSTTGSTPRKSVLPPQRCPACGLINTGGSGCCDCGYRLVNW